MLSSTSISGSVDPKFVSPSVCPSVNYASPYSAVQRCFEASRGQQGCGIKDFSAASAASASLVVSISSCFFELQTIIEINDTHSAKSFGRGHGRPKLYEVDA